MFSALAIKPIKQYKATPKEYKIKYETIVVQNGNAKITTWFLQQSSPNAKSILICNSDYGNMSFSLPIATQLYEKGFNVIMFDYRGFGSSSNFAIDTNKLFYNEFCDDLESVYKSYSSKTKSAPIIYGTSMGTIIATNCYSKNPKLFNTKFVFDSFIESFKNTKMVLLSLKNRTFSAPISDSTYDINIRKMKNAKVLIFKGSEDNVSFKSGSNLSSSNWRVINFEGGHMQGSYVLGADYYARIIEFIGK